MACLSTFEGEYCLNDSQILDALFDCNDAIGCQIYGPELWNEIKSHVANMATREIVLNRRNLGKLPVLFCRSNRDSIDAAFGFNNELGTELMGVDGWGEFVTKAKTAVPPPVLGSVFSDIYDAATNLENIVDWSVGAMLPASASGEDLLKFATGYQQIKTGINTVKDLTGQTARERREKEEEEEARSELLRRQQEAVKAVQESVTKQAEARAKEQEEKTRRATDPEYQSAVNTRIFLIGGMVLLAVIAARKGGR